jgi:MoaA/NifB/PqqE/SkfB family radical SAM enzyme
MYLQKNEIDQFTVELTTRCNAGCPMCSRYNEAWDTRAPNKQLPMLDFDIEVFKKFFTPTVLSTTKKFLFNGKFGDPLIHPKFLEFVKYIKDNSNCKIMTHTNASLRTVEWWSELGSMLDTDDIIVFNVDGLADTNLIYRQRTDFNKIMQNAQSFINAGGTADWEFLVFKHNEHQVEDAKSLAKELGFRKFTVRKTSRFKDNSSFSYTDINGNPATIYPPDNSDYRYDYEGNYLGGETPPENLCIKCDWKTQRKMFVSMTHRLWPCTYISEYYPELPGFNTMNEIKDRHGISFNDITKYTLEEILNHEFFASELETAWKTGKNITKECWKKCSVGARSITERS